MATSPKLLSCDGCGLPASPEHISERVHRLELTTRFRPVHTGVLFVALAPSVRPEDDFYGPPESKEFFDRFLEALEIPILEDKAASWAGANAKDAARLAEFQRRGYYLAYLSECPIRADVEPVTATISRLGPTSIRRIRFNYRPKNIAVIGEELVPLIEMLKGVGIGPLLTSSQGAALSLPRSGDLDGMKQFQRAFAAVAPRENLSTGL
jgi:hypothetical protein